MSRPNIILITSDQHRADCLGVAGHPCVATPHLDQLADSGICFDQAHVDAPVCIPARTTLVTGIQSHRYGMCSYSEDYRVDRPRDRFLGALLTRAGYQTELIGKRHWHTDPAFRGGFENVTPLALLGEERRRHGRPYGTTGLGANEVHAGLSQYPPELQSTDWLIDQSIAFLRHRRDPAQPFCLWVSLIDPHPPFIIHEPYYSMYDHDAIPEPVQADWADAADAPIAFRFYREAFADHRMTAAQIRKARAVYYGMITNIDYQLGRLFGELLGQGLWDESCIVYSSDHGELLGDYGSFFKSRMLEAAARVPLIVKAPASWQTAPGRRSDALVEWADLLPTFCSMAQADIPDDVSGTDLNPLLRDEVTSIRSHWHGQVDNQHAWRDAQYKYCYFADDGAELVFDLANDPLEQQDLSGDAELTDRLRRQFIAHLQEEGHTHVDAEGRLRVVGSPLPQEAERMRLAQCKGLPAARRP